MMVMSTMYCNDKPPETLRVYIHQHVRIDAGFMAFSYVPKDTTVTTTYPGYVSEGPRSLTSDFHERWKMRVQQNTPNDTLMDKITYEEGTLYRDVGIYGYARLMTFFERGTDNPYLIVWSMYIMYQMYKNTHRTTLHAQTLSNFVRFVKDTFIWFEKHDIFAHHCQVITHNNQTFTQNRIRTVFEIYQANFETLVFFQLVW